jgi:hypothetical protein
MSGDPLQLIYLLGALVGWCLYCGILTHVLDQPRTADQVATALGVLILIFALR